jgi:pyrimidine-nucleoside phosphorylase
VVDPSVGFVIGIKPGDRVERGEPVATIFAHDAEGIAAGRAALGESIVVADEAPAALPLISHRVTSAGVEPWAPLVSL